MFRAQFNWLWLIISLFIGMINIINWIGIIIIVIAIVTIINIFVIWINRKNYNQKVMPGCHLASQLPWLTEFMVLTTLADRNDPVPWGVGHGATGCWVFKHWYVGPRMATGYWLPATGCWPRIFGMVDWLISQLSMVMFSVCGIMVGNNLPIMPFSQSCVGVVSNDSNHGWKCPC